LLEVAADDVDKIVEIDLGVRIERVDVVHRDQSRRHVPLVVPRALVFGDDVGFGLVVGAKKLDVHFRIFVADRRVGEKAQRLMHAHRPAHLLHDIGFDHLRAPIAVVAADEARDADVVEKARKDDFFTMAGLERVCCALQQVRGGGEPCLEEVDQRRLVRHLRQPRVGAHDEVFARIGCLEGPTVLDLDPAVGHVEQNRLGSDALAQIVHHLFFELVRAF
jgi:hypothetical protein